MANVSKEELNTLELKIVFWLAPLIDKYGRMEVGVILDKLSKNLCYTGAREDFKAKTQKRGL